MASRAPFDSLHSGDEANDPKDTRGKAKQQPDECRYGA
jgi:hypothetical protein